MCELFGINSKEIIKCNEMLKDFFSHGIDNPHGWGIAAFYGNAVSLEKEPVSSTESVYLKHRLTEDIENDKLIAHIRKASKGGNRIPKHASLCPSRQHRPCLDISSQRYYLRKP